MVSGSLLHRGQIRVQGLIVNVCHVSVSSAFLHVFCVQCVSVSFVCMVRVNVHVCVCVRVCVCAYLCMFYVHCSNEYCLLYEKWAVKKSYSVRYSAFLYISPV